MPPPIDVVAHAQHFGLNDGPAAFLGPKICARQEDLPDSNQLIFIRFVACAAHLIVKELHWNLDVDTCTVASLSVSINSTAVPNRL